MRKVIFQFLLLILISPIARAQQPKHATGTQYPSYKGLIMAGYQGWFGAPANGVMYPDETKVRIDMWPDVSEYEVTYPTGLKLAGGSTARFFSSRDQSTIDLHFKWMKEYGVDGVFMQRFFGAARPGNERNIVLKNAFDAASKYERAIAVMYDLSGLKGSGEDCSRLIEDWKYLVDSLKVTNQKGVKTYLHHNGKPLVAIWGIGFPDRPYNTRSIGIERLIDFLKNDPVYGGCAVMLGVPTFWRELNADCLPDPYLHEVIKSADIVLPWMVQRFTPLLHNDMDRYRDVIIEDIKWCKAAGIDYVPCVTPGFSWHNLSRFEFPDDVKPVGSIPRQGGRFYWQQLSTAINAGASMIYVAMFDEVNEGTAIFKVSTNPPVSDVASFVKLDGEPSDHYLWLTGEAAKMLRGQKTRVDFAGRAIDKHASAPVKHYDSYKGLIMTGYQGWFSCPGDGSDRGWYHYQGRDGFKPGSCTIDMWPDVSEYEHLYKTEFKFADGTPAFVMSEYDESTVRTHFRWMREYGIDGAFIQRFVAEIKRPKSYGQLNKVWHSAIHAANDNNRAISAMYDLSGMAPGDEQLVLKDIDQLEAEYHFKDRKENPSYLYHNGKPLVAVWGVGFNDNRRYGFKEAEIIIDGLLARGYSIMIGVPTQWRLLTGDTLNDKELHRLIKKCDIVMPWFVGRYNEERFPSFEQLVKDDLAWCKKNKLDYAPLAFPGFSWVNMRENSTPIDRNKGNFYWKQLSSHIANGAGMIYAAMFDEIDEGTAIFKCAKVVPVGESYFLPIDGELETDHYLWLTGQAGRMLRKEMTLSREMPKR